MFVILQNITLYSEAANKVQVQVACWRLPHGRQMDCLLALVGMAPAASSDRFFYTDTIFCCFAKS